MARLLTDTTIRNIRTPEAGQLEVADHCDVKGFMLRVGKAGTKAFYLLYRSPENGKQARIKVGTYPAMPLADARQKARAYRALIERGSTRGLTKNRKTNGASGKPRKRVAKPSAGRKIHSSERQGVSSLAAKPLACAAGKSASGISAYTCRLLGRKGRSVKSPATM